MKKFLSIITLTLALAVSASAQRPILMHSHNDYLRTAPFWEAYSQRAYSIEADLHCVDGKLLVGHDLEDLRDDMTFEQMYVEPIVTMFHRNGGHMWAYSEDKMQLMVELKDDTEPELSTVVEMLSRYPDVFNKDAVRVVITGNVPEPKDFYKYPDFIYFDGDFDETYTPEQLERVGLFSSNFRRYSEHYNGKGAIMPDELARVKAKIDEAHSMGKGIRFWGAPESTTTYYTFHNLGVDYINTDKPATCAAFFNDWSNKNFSIGRASESTEGTTGTQMLDKLTRNFKGFQNSKLQLSEGIPTYQPTYLNDGATDKPIKNVILLIGDGMCYSQIAAAAYANGRDLTLLNMKYMGMHFNNSVDEFTTDSAAGGSALGTGVAHLNRHISADANGLPVESLADYFHAHGKATGSVSLGDVADATPAVFYAHTTERDSIDLITSQMLTSTCDLICGSGTDSFYDREDGLNMDKEFKKHKVSFVKDIHEINKHKGRVVCVDDRLGKAAEESNLHLLADLTKETLQKMQACDRKGKGFFVMIEGAKIDYAGHSMCLPGSILEQMSFDLCIQEALKFADSNGETLVIVTADHETGGLVLLDGDVQSGRIMGEYTSNDHSPAMIPIFAYGPGAQNFIGTMLNTDVANRIKETVK